MARVVARETPVGIEEEKGAEVRLEVLDAAGVVEGEDVADKAVEQVAFVFELCMESGK